MFKLMDKEIIKINHFSGLQIRVGKLFFLFLNQNICCGNLLEPSQWDIFLEHPKHVFKFMDKKIIKISYCCFFQTLIFFHQNIFFYFSTKTYVVGTQKNRLNKTVLLSTQKQV